MEGITRAPAGSSATGDELTVIERPSMQRDLSRGRGLPLRDRDQSGDHEPWTRRSGPAIGRVDDDCVGSTSKWFVEASGIPNWCRRSIPQHATPRAGESPDETRPRQAKPSSGSMTMSEARPRRASDYSSAVYALDLRSDATSGAQCFFVQRA